MPPLLPLRFPLLLSALSDTCRPLPLSLLSDTRRLLRILLLLLLTINKRGAILDCEEVKQ